MTEQCKLCGTERIDEEEFCHKSGCGYHFESQSESDPSWLSQDMGSYQKKLDKEEAKQQPPESDPDPSFVQSEDEWEKNRKEMENEQERSESTTLNKNGEQGILVLPDGKEILITENSITIGRNDVSEYVEFKLGENPNEVSSQQFTIWQEDGHYFIEDRITSVQNKQSANGTRVNGDNISGHLKQELHDNDKIEFAHIEKCVATFQLG